MCFADRGFVFLSMPKAGSTVLQKHFARHAMILFRQPPGMKHMSAVTFEAVHGALAGALRPPARRLRDDVPGPAPARPGGLVVEVPLPARGPGQPNWTGDLSFAEFADRLVSGEVPLGTSANFVTDAEGTVIVDRMYRYEHLDVATAWMSERLGIPAPALEPTNVSPAREGEMDAATRARLEEHFAKDLAIYESGSTRRPSGACRSGSGGRSRPTMAAMHPGFRQDIQGLRALAVLLVILDHAKIGPFHGGFIGVDVFFVISGFLITGLLVSEAERTGRVSLLGFYARRARRILPAATLVIVATVGRRRLLPQRRRGERRDQGRALGDVLRGQLQARPRRHRLLPERHPALAAAALLVAGGGGAVLRRLAAAGPAALPVRRVAGPAQRGPAQPRPAGP